jgi:hypothetical protein
MKMLCALGGALISTLLAVAPSGAVRETPSGDTCTATGNGTAYSLAITLPSNAVEQGAFAVGAPGATVTGIKVTGNPGTFSTTGLPAGTSATWRLTDPTYVAPGSEVDAVVTTSHSITGSFTVVPATAGTNGQAITYLDPIQCGIVKGTAPPSSKFSVQLHFTFSAGMWHFFVTVPGAGRVTVAGRSSPKLLIRTRTIAVKSGKTRLTIVPTAAGKATLAASGSLKLKLVVEFAPTGGKSATKTFAVALRK